MALRFLGHAEDQPDAPSAEELNAGKLMDPAERLRTLLARCSRWPMYWAEKEMREALVGFAADYEALREQVARLQETVTSLVGDGRG